MDFNTIWIGSDHGGYSLKLDLIEHIKNKGLDVFDVGSKSADIVRYPHYACQVAAAVSEGRAKRGILICSTGIGMSIIANKFKGVRASLCTDAFMGEMTRRHNDSNILCLGGKITPSSEALKILDSWLENAYDGGRHEISLGIIRKAEEYFCLQTGVDDLPQELTNSTEQ